MTNFAQLGIEIESKDAVTAATNLDNMAEAGKRAEKATDDLKKSTTDWAAEQAKANARASEMAAAEAKIAASSKNAAAGVADQKKELANLLGTIDPVIAKLGKLDDMEQKLQQFRKRGLIDTDTFSEYNKKLNEQRALLGKVNDVQGMAGISAAQYSNAIRQLPAQFTDIFTSLASGQNPLLVLIQQGGQIKDSFGGIGNALQAAKNGISSFFDGLFGASDAIKSLDGIADSADEIDDISKSAGSGVESLADSLNTASEAANNAGPAIDAVTNSSRRMIAVVGIYVAVAAAIAAVGIAAYKGSQEAKQFERALALTGNAAGVTSSQLATMASNIDANSDATQAAASRALSEVVRTGKIASENFSAVADAALRMNMATGKSVSDTVEEFVKLAEDPVEAIIKLSDTQKFLTFSVYEQISALQDQGRQQEAAAIATKAYADATINAANSVSQNLGTLEKAWKYVKIGASEAWDAMMGIGRDVTAAQELQKLIADNQRDLNSIQNASDSRIPGSEAAIPKLRADIMARYDRIKEINSQMERERTEAEKKSASQAANEIAIANAQLIDSQATKEEQRRKAIAAKTTEINSAIEKAKYAGDIKLAEQLEGQRAAAIAAIEKKYRDPKTGKIANPAKSDISQAQSLIDSANRQIEANKQIADSGEAVSASRRKIIEIDQRMEEAGNLMTAAQRQQLEVAKEQLATTDKLAQARQQLTRDSAANAAMEERLAAASRQQREQNEVSLMGIGRGGDAATMAQRQLDIRREYLKQIDDLEKAQRNKNTALSGEELQRQKDMLEASLQERLALEQSYQNQRMAMLGDWRNGFTASFEDYSAQAANVAGQTKSLFDSAFKGAEDAMVKFAMTGKLSFKDFANSIIADLIRIAAKQAVLQIAGTIAGAFAGGASGGSGVGSTQLGNNYNWGGGFSGGGYTGDGGKYQPKGVVHAGEVVWSQRDVAAVGGPRAANAMRPTAGYANGGGPGLPASRGMQSSAAPQVIFNITTENGNTNVTQQGAADALGKELEAAVVPIISKWWARNSKPGGAVYNGRMGTA